MEKQAEYNTLFGIILWTIQSQPHGEFFKGSDQENSAFKKT